MKEQDAVKEIKGLVKKSNLSEDDLEEFLNFFKRAMEITSDDVEEALEMTHTHMVGKTGGSYIPVIVRPISKIEELEDSKYNRETQQMDKKGLKLKGMVAFRTEEDLTVKLATLSGKGNDLVKRMTKMVTGKCYKISVKVNTNSNDPSGVCTLNVSDTATPAELDGSEIKQKKIDEALENVPIITVKESTKFKVGVMPKEAGDKGTRGDYKFGAIIGRVGGREEEYGNTVLFVKDKSVSYGDKVNKIVADVSRDYYEDITNQSKIKMYGHITNRSEKPPKIKVYFINVIKKVVMDEEDTDGKKKKDKDNEENDEDEDKDKDEESDDESPDDEEDEEKKEEKKKVKKEEKKTSKKKDKNEDDEEKDEDDGDEDEKDEDEEDDDDDNDEEEDEKKDEKGVLSKSIEKVIKASGGGATLSEIVEIVDKKKDVVKSEIEKMIKSGSIVKKDNKYKLKKSDDEDDDEEEKEDKKKKKKDDEEDSDDEYSAKDCSGFKKMFDPKSKECKDCKKNDEDGYNICKKETEKNKKDD